MRHVLTLVADPSLAPLDDSTLAVAREALAGLGAALLPAESLDGGQALDLPFDLHGSADLRAAIAAALAGRRVDWAVQPAAGRRKRLLLADMDSTIIDSESLDELAAHAGFGERVAAITARSMAGEIDFADALRERVALLEGLSAGAIDAVARAIRINPGARTLVRTMAAHGAHTILVSGGFRHFTALVRDAVGFHEDLANVLEVVGERLTGKVAEPILDRGAKRATLTRAAAERGLPESAALAVGDGANDLDMIRAAGLGVAWRGKAILADAADGQVDHADLTALLYFQGYRRDEFVREDDPA